MSTNRKIVIGGMPPAAMSQKRPNADRVFYPPSLPRAAAPPPAPSPRPSCEHEIRAIGDRLRRLVATDSDAPRYITEHIVDTLPQLERDRAYIADLKHDLASAEKDMEKLQDDFEDADDNLVKWRGLYAESPEPLTGDGMKDHEALHAFMAAFREWNVMAAALYNS